jgi:hypothetical protein
MLDFLSRLPTYSLPLALGFIEYSLRRFLKIDYPSEFLPASIAAGGLGLLSAIVVNEVPPVALAALSKRKQSVLKALSAIAFLVFFFGLGLWFEIAGENLAHGTTSLLPQLSLFGWGGFLTYAAGFYIIGLILNEVKSGASK